MEANLEVGRIKTRRANNFWQPSDAGKKREMYAPSVPPKGTNLAYNVI